jgi:S-(hydroxymethyl)glutathione dehydrogenase/alcohol dehydrogenase
VVVPEACVIKINPEMPLAVAALLGCGVPTGWGSAAISAEIEYGDTVVVVGLGGVGMNAVQGAAQRGAKHIVGVDPVAFKRDSADVFGATQTVANYDDAAELVAKLTNGQGAERVIVTVDVARSDVIQPAAALTKRGGVLVVTSASSPMQQQIDFDLCTFVMSGKRLQGNVYGGSRPRIDIPLLADMYLNGRYKLDELVTRRYPLEKINDAFEDMRSGRNIRGLIVFED